MSSIVSPLRLAGAAPTAAARPAAPLAAPAHAAALVAPEAPAGAKAGIPAAVPGTTSETSANPTSGRLPKAVFRFALQQALDVDPNAAVAVDHRSNSATFLSGNFKVEVNPGATGSPDEVARTFLGKHGMVFGITDTTTQLQLLGVSADTLGFKHARYQQMYQGLPVFGQQIVVHSKDAEVRSVGGHVTPNIRVQATPRHSVEQALVDVKSSLKPAVGTAPVSLAQDGRKLGIYTTGDGTPHLAWQLVVKTSGDTPGRWMYYVDAQDGKVLDHWSAIDTALNRRTYSAKNGDARPGKLMRKEGQGPVGDAVVDAAHDNAEAVYDFYKTMFGRDSLDDKGMKLVSTVHYGDKYNNAYWDGTQMTYGDGDGDMFTPFAVALDVVGHEMTHGVTEHTANLEYFKQSGALNESWSDVMGNIIEKWDEARKNPSAPERDPKWLIGEQIFTPKIDGDALRSMSAPGTAYPKDPQPADMAHYKNIDWDNGGVHVNSGIPNKAAYEVAMKVGRDKLAAIWYRAQTQYLTSTAQFSDAANVTLQAAADLYGKTSAEVQAVRDAWTSVGLTPTAAPGIIG